ncbi:MAG TPA: creatininase family protein [Chthoniobacteraceae bacterium]|nr:creatininase family protein [Chthoniobacteraceae bacterium]
MWWHEKTWKQLDLLDRNLPVVVPIASCEQHGPHLPVWVDTLQLTGILERVEPLVSEQALFLPVLWLGSSHHHADFPGTLSLTPFLYAQVLKGLLENVIRAGFRRVLVLNGHGGNEAPALAALNELVGTSDEADRISLALATWWKIASDGLDADALGMETPRLSHACEYETSLTLALRPDLVRMSAAPEGWEEQRPWVQPASLPNVASIARFHRFTRTGALGRPAAATAQKGERILSVVCESLQRLIVDFAAWPVPEAGRREG